MPEDTPIQRDELIGALTLILLFISIVGGREIGNYYASYEEMTRLTVLFEVTEEELSRYVINLIQGDETDLEIGLIITAPGANNTADLVIDTPDYVNRWLVGLTVSPIVVNQPEASDVELEMFIEDDLVDRALHIFPRQKISYITFTDRSIRLNIEDIEGFAKVVDEAALDYGGEIKVIFRGRIHMHLLFLDTWLPFSVTRYPIIKAPNLEYSESSWRSYTNGQVSVLSVDEGGYILGTFKNPTRIHSLKEDMTCMIFKEGDTMPFMNVTKSVQVPPGINGQYTFPFTLTEPGNYTYIIISKDRVLTNNSQVLSVE
jgi:hypothetical protein